MRHTQSQYNDWSRIKFSESQLKLRVAVYFQAGLSQWLGHNISIQFIILINGSGIFNNLDLFFFVRSFFFSQSKLSYFSTREINNMNRFLGFLKQICTTFFVSSVRFVPSIIRVSAAIVMVVFGRCVHSFIAFGARKLRYRNRIRVSIKRNLVPSTRILKCGANYLRFSVQSAQKK